MNRRTTALGFALALALAACDGGGDSVRPPDEDHRPSSSSSSVSTATDQHPGTGNNGTPCPPSGTTADGKPLGDVDGDGDVDGVYLSGGNLGVATSTGVVSEVRVAGARAVKVAGVADANEDGRDEIFVVGAGPSGTEVVAYTVIAVFADCRLALLTDVDGDVYSHQFGKSDGGGSGVGCVDADGDGKRELVGLTFERNGPEVRWTRTIVRIDGTVATNGQTDEGTFTSPQDDDKIALLSDLTCGDDPVDPVDAALGG